MALSDVKLLIHTSDRPEDKEIQAEFPRRRSGERKKRTSFQERLLRNSCLACAVLLGVLALSNVDRPWAQKASGSIEKALTMKIDLDRSIGQMSFVQKIMPESALVFFNLPAAPEHLPPVDAPLSHAYSEAQPYLMFDCGAAQDVICCGDGTVSAVSALSDGSWGVLIDHGGGRESVTAGMGEICVAVGDALSRGDAIGSGGRRLYFELREGGSAVNPAEKIGL